MPLNDSYDATTNDGSGNGVQGILSQIAQMPTLRPFVVATIPAQNDFKIGGSSAGESSLVVDDIVNQETRKFRFLRSFQYAMSSGATCELILFDDSGKINPVIQNLYSSFKDKMDDSSSSDADADNESSAGNRFMMNVQWGWSVPLVDPTTGQVVEKRIVSHVHKFLVQSVEITYVDGGIGYRITGDDKIRLLQASVQKQITPMITTEAAYTWLMTDEVHKPALPPPLFARGDRAPEEVTRHWATNSVNTLETLRIWSSHLQSKRGYPVRTYWSTILNRLVVDDVNTDDTENMIAEEIYGPHDVNWWDQSKGGNIVLKFDPKINPHMLVGMTTQIAGLRSGERSIHDTATNQQASTQGTSVSKNKGAGSNAAATNLSADDPLNEDKSTQSVAKTGDSLRPTGTGQFVGIAASMECIGWPRADNFENVKNKLVWLNIYDPYGLASANGVMGWESNGRNEELSGPWLINNITHVIDDTGYRMTLDLTRMPKVDENVGENFKKASGGS
jgi:hypothetical protein